MTEPPGYTLFPGLSHFFSSVCADKKTEMKELLSIILTDRTNKQVYVSKNQSGH